MGKRRVQAGEWGESMSDRDYEAIVQQIGERVGGDESREERMRAVVDLLWDHLQDHGVSYTHATHYGSDCFVIPRQISPP